MIEGRRYFHEELRLLESRVQSMGAAAQSLVQRSLETVTSDDQALTSSVLRQDDEVDAYYLEIEKGVLDLFALQTPVAGDLRFLTTVLHINFHLERIGDMGVNVAKITDSARGLPRDEGIVATLQEMGTIGLRLLGAAMGALAQRDVELCRQLPEMDEPIDRLNRGMLERILGIAEDKATLEWGINMYLVARQLERIGDHAVDIGEQISFLVTGEFQEFTDASHPDLTS